MFIAVASLQWKMLKFYAYRVINTTTMNATLVDGKNVFRLFDMDGLERKERLRWNDCDKDIKEEIAFALAKW